MFHLKGLTVSWFLIMRFDGIFWEKKVKFTPADAFFVCRQVISGYRVIIINDTKCKYTFNFPKINSACKAGKFVQVGCIIMCICIFNGIMAYQYFSSKSRGWSGIRYYEKISLFHLFFREIDSPIHCYILYPSAHTSPIQWHPSIWNLLFEYSLSSDQAEHRPIVAINRFDCLDCLLLLNNFNVFCTWYHRCYFII